MRVAVLLLFAVACAPARKDAAVPQISVGGVLVAPFVAAANAWRFNPFLFANQPIPSDQLDVLVEDESVLLLKSVERLAEFIAPR